MNTKKWFKNVLDKKQKFAETAYWKPSDVSLLILTQPARENQRPLLWRGWESRLTIGEILFPLHAWQGTNNVNMRDSLHRDANWYRV